MRLNRKMGRKIDPCSTPAAESTVAKGAALSNMSSWPDVVAFNRTIYVDNRRKI